MADEDLVRLLYASAIAFDSSECDDEGCRACPKMWATWHDTCDRLLPPMRVRLLTSLVDCDVPPPPDPRLERRL